MWIRPPFFALLVALSSSVSAAEPASASLLTFAGCDPTGIADSTTCWQTAVKSTPHLVVPAGQYKISSPINITSKIWIDAPWGQATILLATQNQNGLVIGDGTNVTRNALYNTTIDGISFNPAPGVSAFTSGSAIYLNYVSYVNLRNINVYGSDGSSTILYNGITAYKAMEFNITYSRFSYLNGIGVNAYGATGWANATSDGRIDFDEFTNIAGDAIYLGLNAFGNTINSPVIYQSTGTMIHIDVTTSPPTSSNIFIHQPDLEIDTNGEIGIHFTNGNFLQIVGGWIGGNATTSGVDESSSASGLHLHGVLINAGASVTLNGASNTIVGNQIVGDNATGSSGLTLNSGAVNTVVTGNRIAQWPTNGIHFNGNPVNCTLSGNIFKSNGTDVAGWTGGVVGTSPIISGSASDKSATITPSASITLSPGKAFYVLRGSSTAISNMTVLGQGYRVTLQAQDAEGDTVSNGSGPGGILLKNSPTTIPQYHTMSFVCDGNKNWFEDGRNF
jgi:hypothetical protein